MLCLDCHTKLLSSNNFREECLSSAAYLQDILVKHKENVQVQSECSEEDVKNFDEFFEIDYLVRMKLLTTKSNLLFTYLLCTSILGPE